MISAAAILMLSSMLYSLRLSSGSFPKPLSAKKRSRNTWKRLQLGIWRRAISSLNATCVWWPIL